MSEIGFSCATCPCFIQQDERGGVCRRYPPTVHIVPGKLVGQFGPVNMMPAVALDHWCYEHPLARMILSGPVDSRLSREAEGEA